MTWRLALGCRLTLQYTGEHPRLLFCGCDADVLQRRHLSGIQESPAGRRASLGALSAAGQSGGGGNAAEDRGEGRVKGAGAARAELAGGALGKSSA